MLLTILGSGSAQPTARRASAGALLEWSGGALLLDASAGTYMRALRAGLDPAALRALVLTHFHPDHTADLPGLLWARKQTAGLRDRPLVVVGPQGTGALVRRLCAAHGDALAGVAHEVRGFPWSAGGLLVRAFPAAHSPEAQCLRIEADGRVLALSGDTGDGPGVREACRGADLALLECTTPVPAEGHLTPADCEAIVADARPRRVLLTHLGPDVEPALPAAEDGLAVTV